MGRRLERQGWVWGQARDPVRLGQPSLSNAAGNLVIHSFVSQRTCPVLITTPLTLSLLNADGDVRTHKNITKEADSRENRFVGIFP